MCGRYEFDLDDVRIARHFGLKRWEAGVMPRSQVAPSQTLPIITEAEPEQLTLAEWGLTPRWSKEGKPAKRLINARAETVHTLRSFRQAFREQRCLVPATAFFEWQTTAQGKQPYRIALKDNQPFVFAGLYDDVATGESPPRPAYAIITTEANELMAPIHHRMPVILASDDAGAWLDPDTPEEQLKALLRPYPAQAMAAEPVARLANP